MLRRRGGTTLSLISSFELCQTLTELGSSLIITVRGVASCSIFMNKLILVEKINEYAKITNGQTTNGKDRGSQTGVTEQQVDMH
jgi:hypothetical protein